MALTYWPAMHRANRDTWKHGRRVGMLSDDPAALVNQLGGNAAVLAFYDVRRNVVANTSWDDARGATGFGPQLTGTFGYDASAGLITTDGVAQNYGSSAVAAFDCSVAITLVLIGAFSSGAYAGGFAESATAARFLGARLNSGTTIKTQVNPGSVFADSTVTPSATRRVVFAAKNASTTAYVEVPSKAQATVATTGIPAGGQALTIGNYWKGQTGWSATSLRAILVLSGLYTTAQRDTITAWALAAHGAVLA